MSRRPVLVLALTALLAGCGQAGASDDGSAAPPDRPEAPAAASSAAFTPEMREFRDWRAVCDNLGRCSAYGAEGVDGAGWVMVTRDAGADAAVRVRAGVPVWAEDAAPAAVLDGRAVDPGRDDGLALARALSQGQALTLGEGDETVAVSLSGAAAALLWIDEKQGRIGTPTAFMRPGDRDAGTVPAPATAPRVTRAAAVSQAGLPDEDVRLPAALERLPEVQTCAADRMPDMTPMHSVARLGEGTYLWGVECFRGAYNLGQRFWITGEDGANPRPVDFPSATGEPAQELVNAAFDPESAALEAFARGRGPGDCGVIQHWAWTGERFVLTLEMSMLECAGMTPDLWPTLYRSGEQ
ncbi:MAG: DUF1176 domain-containing protein [Brevundimonas sp.]